MKGVWQVGGKEEFSVASHKFLHKMNQTLRAIGGRIAVTELPLLLL